MNVEFISPEYFGGADNFLWFGQFGVILLCSIVHKREPIFFVY